MQRNVLIFHGTAGYPQENWFPWLKEKLEEKGCSVFVPQFPKPEKDSLSSRLKVIDEYKQYINKEVILIGHSRGGLFLLRLLERLKSPIYAAFFVAAPVGIKPYVYYDVGYKFSNGFDFNWKVIKSNSRHFAVYHSDNDPYTCLDNGRKIAKKLGVELTLIPNAGHFNTKSGYTKFERLLDDIKKIL